MTGTIVNDQRFTTQIAGTLLAGEAIEIDPASSVTCAGVYDENYQFYADTCP